MDGFTKLPKMQCFKEGGAVLKDVDTDKNPGLSKLPTELRNKMGYKKDGGAVDKAQDKTMVKKGVSQHEAKLHKGEPKTELKLKQGGRAKKECGTVKKYKVGGTVENAYGTPKTDKDIKDIANTKRQKPKKMQMGGIAGQGSITEAEREALAGRRRSPMAGQGAVTDADRAALAGAMGGGMAAAPSAPMGQGQMTELEKRRMMEKMARAKKYLGPAQQSELIKQSPAAAGLTGGGYKKGGSAKKC